jgi:hypothetical protein
MHLQADPRPPDRHGGQGNDDQRQQENDPGQCRRS